MMKCSGFVMVLGFPALTAAEGPGVDEKSAVWYTVVRTRAGKARDRLQGKLSRPAEAGGTVTGRQWRV